MAFENVCKELEVQYGCAVSPATAEKLLAGNTPLVSALLQKVLHSDMTSVADHALLPRDIGSQPSSAIKVNTMVQIQTLRDITQPLRPCADMDDEEALAIGAANQRNSSKRLLKLTVTDGHFEVPIVELKTLFDVFPKMPFPGEKILLRPGAEVRNGMIIAEQGKMTLLGGSVEQLKEEFLMLRNKLQGGLAVAKGMQGVPCFKPFVPHTQYTVSQSTTDSSTMHNASEAGFRGANRGSSHRGGPQHNEQRGGYQQRHDHRGRGESARGGRGNSSSARGGRGYSSSARGGRGNSYNARGGSFHDPNKDPPSQPQPQKKPTRSYEDEFPSLGDW